MRSRKHNKEILPVLTTAHNYSWGLPIYNFLCNLQYQNGQNLYFDWGPFFAEKKFLPRVIYENIILSPAKWFIEATEVPQHHEKSFEDFHHKIIEWKTNFKLPDLVQIIDGDNKLLIDFNNEHLVRIFIGEVRKKGGIYVEEFLFTNDRDNLVRRGNDYFTNELIMCLHKTK